MQGHFKRRTRCIRSSLRSPSLWCIREGKGAKERLVPITEDLASDLRHLIGRRKDGPLFVSQRGGVSTPFSAVP